MVKPNCSRFANVFSIFAHLVKFMHLERLGPVHLNTLFANHAFFPQQRIALIREWKN